MKTRNMQRPETKGQTDEVHTRSKTKQSEKKIVKICGQKQERSENPTVHHLSHSETK